VKKRIKSLISGHQQLKDLFPDHINTATSALQSLQLNTDHQLISKIRTKHTYPTAARLARILKIPLENKVSFPTRYIRLEFDHCTANYYIEIDTIKLCGYCSPVDLPVSTVNKTIEKQEEITENDCSDNLTKLPFDLLFLICTYLDLPSLVRLSSTCRHLHEKCLHSLQFLSMDLQPYWNNINNASIENFFLNHCTQTRFLSLAWTQSINYSLFTELLTTCSNNLAQLNLGCCQYLDGKYIEAIVESCPKVEILNFESCIQLSSEDFIPLKNLMHLRSLNVYRTAIDYRTLLPLINNNQKHFESINIGKITKKEKEQSISFERF
jgi:F-box/leucine-rich repeat protein 4